MGPARSTWVMPGRVAICSCGTKARLRLRWITVRAVVVSTTSRATVRSMPAAAKRLSTMARLPQPAEKAIKRRSARSAQVTFRAWARGSSLRQASPSRMWVSWSVMTSEPSSAQPWEGTGSSMRS
ncbi:hypothetical protein SNA_20330 [Streptomyces natalensis ATCC 27448]|uniref:Uncharacterized protein n=1 Tax=Streptomyces natalensis ATCC 27448 TaxID=1240678 RepID=A0A0D7CK03_9ACTN|nr:hypothetical protein SNA_20330 [Streptomyces natalensis ATCC 27448]